jgi:hypothetical protein
MSFNERFIIINQSFNITMQYPVPRNKTRNYFVLIGLPGCFNLRMLI